MISSQLPNPLPVLSRERNPDLFAIKKRLCLPGTDSSGQHASSRPAQFQKTRFLYRPSLPDEAPQELNTDAGELVAVTPAQSLSVLDTQA